MKAVTKLLTFSKSIASTAEHVHTCKTIEDYIGLLDTNIHFTTTVHAAKT